MLEHVFSDTNNERQWISMKNESGQRLKRLMMSSASTPVGMRISHGSEAVEAGGFFPVDS
jgi:hypothetical protein